MNDENPIFGGWRTDGFSFKKTWNTFAGELIVGRNSSGERRNEVLTTRYEQMLYALKLDWKPNEKFFLGGIGYYQNGDRAIGNTTNIKTYAVNAGFKFTPAVELKGIYYWQKYDDVAFDDSQKSWKAILDIKQEALKFTSLWIEYSQESNHFGGNNTDGNGWVARYSLGTYSEPSVLSVRPRNDQTSKYWFVKAEQKWNKKWGSFLRYTHADWDTAGQDNATEWGVGVTYQYTPAIAFMLAYDSIDYGKGGFYNGGATALEDKDNVILFRTTVKF